MYQHIIIIASYRYQRYNCMVVIMYWHHTQYLYQDPPIPFDILCYYVTWYPYPQYPPIPINNGWVWAYGHVQPAVQMTSGPVGRSRPDKPRASRDFGRLRSAVRVFRSRPAPVTSYHFFRSHQLSRVTGGPLVIFHGRIGLPVDVY